VHIADSGRFSGLQDQHAADLSLPAEQPLWPSHTGEAEARAAALLAGSGLLCQASHAGDAKTCQDITKNLQGVPWEHCILQNFSNCEFMLV
jgi:hypothetical protein